MLGLSLLKVRNGSGALPEPKYVGLRARFQD